jgi:peroxiredoxin
MKFLRNISISIGWQFVRSVHSLRAKNCRLSHQRLTVKALATTMMMNIALTARYIHAAGDKDISGPEKSSKKPVLKTYDNCDQTCGEGNSKGDLKRAASCDSSALCKLPLSASVESSNGAPDYSILSEARLSSWPPGQHIYAHELWKNRPVVVLVVRRMGCPLCRAVFAEVSRRRAEFDALGVGLVAISQQDIGAKDFLDAVWSNLPLYIDAEDSFRSALGAEVAPPPPFGHDAARSHPLCSRGMRALSKAGRPSQQEARRDCRRPSSQQHKTLY